MVKGFKLRGKMLPFSVIQAIVAIMTMLLLVTLWKPLQRNTQGSGNHLLQHTAESMSRLATVGHQACRAISKSIPPLKTRYDIAALLQTEGMLVGAELGVQYGGFAAHTLKSWPGCKRYYLVDLWQHQDNYKDRANVGQERQQTIMNLAKANLKAWQEKTVFLRNYTTSAVHDVHELLDYIYVDARHDYCGVLEDIEAWWPKLRPGGIMAGHDFETAPDVAQISKQDWSVCGDGSIHPGAVVGAVNDFFTKLNMQVTVTYREKSFNTWIVRKPELICNSFDTK